MFLAVLLISIFNWLPLSVHASEIAMSMSSEYLSQLVINSLIKSKILSEVASMMHGQIIENQINF